MSESPPGRPAGPQAGGVAPKDRAETGPAGRGHAAGAAPLAGDGPDCAAGRGHPGQTPDDQVLRRHNHRDHVYLPAQDSGSPSAGPPGRALRDSDPWARIGADGGRGCTELQATLQSGAGLPAIEDGRPEGAPDPPLHPAAHRDPLFHLYAGRICSVAPESPTGPAAVGRGEPRRGDTRPGRRPGGAIRSHTPKSGHENNTVWDAGDELPVPDATLVDADQSPPRRALRPDASGRARRPDPDAKAGLQTARRPLPVGPLPVARISLNFRVKSTPDRPLPTLKYYKLPF